MENIKNEIIFLGSGGGLVSTKENYHSNMIFRRKIINCVNEYQNKTYNLLIDCGSHWQFASEEFGLNIKDVSSIFITHLHADHCGGLEYLGFKTYFGSYPFGQNKIRLIGNVEVLEELWHTVLGGMRSLQGQTNTLETFFDPEYVKPNGSFMWSNIVFNLVQTVHMVDDRRICPSYGLMFKPGEKRVFITGDTQFAPHALFTYYEMADIIFHDCELKKYGGSVHAQYHELCGLPEHIKEKMWLYHYSLDGQELPDKVKEDGFLGFVKKFQTISLD